MAKQPSLRIRLQAYDHKIIDFAVEKIIEVAKKTGAKVVGPVPLPTEKQVYTILRATFKYKDSREQFEIRTHKRLIDIVSPQKETVEAIRKSTRLKLHNLSEKAVEPRFCATRNMANVRRIHSSCVPIPSTP